MRNRLEAPRRVYRESSKMFMRDPAPCAMALTRDRRGDGNYIDDEAAVDVTPEDPPAPSPYSRSWRTNIPKRPDDQFQPFTHYSSILFVSPEIYLILKPIDPPDSENRCLGREAKWIGAYALIGKKR